jgi:hypothetical protein
MKQEHTNFRSALQGALNERDGEARDLVQEFERAKKSTIRMLEQDPDVNNEHLVSSDMHCQSLYNI